MLRLGTFDTAYLPRHCETPEELKALREAKRRIKRRKHGGDDAYSWAVFADRRPVATGESNSQSASIVARLQREFVEKAVAR